MTNKTPPQYQGVAFLEPYHSYRVKILFKCLICDNEWQTTPQVVSKANEKGFNGCPKCKQIRNYSELQAANKASLKPHIIPDPSWDGNRNFARGKVKFTNTICGHEFSTYPNYVLRGKTECTVCGEYERVEELKNRNKRRRTAQNYDAWMEYKNRVGYLTRKTYYTNLVALNPNNYPIGLCGSVGSYQIDHIVPKSVAYRLDIPEDLISHVDNLQVIPWEENRQKGAKLEFIPSIFDAYRDIIIEYYKDKSNAIPIS